MAEEKSSDKLDALIKEFEAADKKAPAPAASPALQELLKEFKTTNSFVKTKMLEEARTSVQKDVDEAVGALLEADEAKGMPKKVIKGFLIERYNEDQNFKAAFDNRSKDKGAWNKALETARAELAAELKGMPQNKVRNDVEAAKAAVKGAKATAEKDTSEPDANAMFGMSDQDWKRYMAKKAAEARA